MHIAKTEQGHGTLVCHICLGRNKMGNPLIKSPLFHPRQKAAAFDVDGTLFNWVNATWPKSLRDYELWSEQVVPD